MDVQRHHKRSRRRKLNVAWKQLGARAEAVGAIFGQELCTWQKTVGTTLAPRAFGSQICRVIRVIIVMIARIVIIVIVVLEDIFVILAILEILVLSVILTIPAIKNIIAFFVTASAAFVLSIEPPSFGSMGLRLRV